MSDDRSDLVKGTLDLLVLKTLSAEAMHGWGISRRIELMSSGAFSVNQGSLYPALQRMKRKGWIRSEWRTTTNQRRARYYELTRAGEARLTEEHREWQRASTSCFSATA
jgi:transcriptional regulator